ncbi:MAG TPA: DinB family protein [Chryseolinea sp.]|nr:DinB family protein [Chryseolinea sp.]
MASLTSAATELRQIVENYQKAFTTITEAELSAKPRPEKWSRKEVIGHLIDSAQNNLRRFICGQYEESPPHIIYAQDFWVEAAQYNRMEALEIIHLWKLINERICAVLEKMPPEKYSRLCNTGQDEPSLHSIEWLAIDYVVHLKHHINQIIPGSFDVRYPQ